MDIPWRDESRRRRGCDVDIPRTVRRRRYGVQCARTCAQISRACRVGRVDVVVQSTDKNFLVPVGGAVVAGPDAKIVATIGKAYPGRASAAPTVDLLCTLLGLGRRGWRDLLEGRERRRDAFEARLAEVAAAHGERVLETPHNRISFGVTLDALAAKASAVEAARRTGGPAADARSAVNDRCTKFGSMLFTRCVSRAARESTVRSGRLRIHVAVAASSRHHGLITSRPRRRRDVSTD